ncbi:MAG: hypothetical protein ACXVYY_01300 [Oryzihumus sp.]
MTHPDPLRIQDDKALAEALSRGEDVVPRRVPCGMVKVLTELANDQPESFSKLLAVLDNLAVPASFVADVLTKHGHQVSDQTVRRHRRRGTAGGCRCPR